MSYIKRFYEGLKGLYKTIWGTTKKCKKKKFNLIFSVRPGLGRIKRISLRIGEESIVEDNNDLQKVITKPYFLQNNIQVAQSFIDMGLELKRLLEEEFCKPKGKQRC